MKLTWLLVLALVVSAVVAKDRSKKRDRNGHNKRVNRGQQEDPREVDMDDADDEYETVDVVQEGGQPETNENPCSTHKCRRGEVCVLDERNPTCVCQTCEDPAEDEDVLKACSTKNVTYASECHLDKDHCLCHNRQPGCTDEKENKIRLGYYRACREITKCPDEELKSFPARMRDWLMLVMTDMAMRGYEEVDKYRDLLESARNDKMHAGAVLWKFSDLDVLPADRHVTRRELMYIIASMKPMEHCMVPFLNHCDADNDDTINLQEWGHCLELSEEDIVNMFKHVPHTA